MTGMTGIFGTWTKAARGLRVGLVCFGVTLSLAGAAMADTAYGCADLLTSDLEPSLEGTGGTFFRLFPDLQSFHWLEAETVAQMADLSRALEWRGTRLIYVPVPTKSLAMPGALPPRAADLGYDIDIAASVYDNMLGWLRDAGIRAVDARGLLRRGTQTGHDPFFGPDPRLTPKGAEILAQGLATEIADALEESVPVRLTSGADVPLHSVQRLKLQTHCIGRLPDLLVPQIASLNSATQRSATVPAVTGDGAAPASVVLLGTEIALDPALHLADTLAAYARTDVASYMVTGEDARGDALAALSSYLTAPGFDQLPPRVLIWANPVWLNPARYGSRPLGEAVAAARGGCSVDVALTNRGNGVYRGDLTAAGLAPGDALLLDAGGQGARRADFRFLMANGVTHRRIITRHPEQVATGRFFLPLSALPRDGAVSVEVQLDLPTTQAPRLALCKET